MVNVLADLAVDSEAATTVVMRIAGAVDRAVRGDAAEKAFRRVALSVTKYCLCKRLASHTVEALECLGGNGYVEDSGMPRLYREAPLVSIWEGSGNVAALDTLRAMGKQPETVEAFFAELDLAAGADAALRRRARAAAQGARPISTTLQFRARRIVEQMAMLLQGSLLLRHGDPAVADAFVALPARPATGASPTARCRPGVDTAAILDRARVAVSWSQGLTDGDDSLFAGRPAPADEATYPTLTYEVTGRIARITFNRPGAGQRDHAGHPARPRARRRARRPRPAGARDRRVRPGERLLRRLRPGDLRRAATGAADAAARRRAARRDGARPGRAGPQPRPVAAPGTRWSTTR